MSEYDAEFFAEEGRVARRSSLIVCRWLCDRYEHLWGASCIDVGCGTGEWALSFSDITDGWMLGIDAHAPNSASIPRLYADIANGIDCTGWDLAICLEVAEHLPAESAEPLVAGLAKAGTVLFSAATPNQPGVGHIHCMPHDYWHGLFAEHGMTPEFIGDQFDEPVADFYRRNMYLYRRAT